MAHTREFEEYLSSFPIGQQFRLVDPLGQYWNNDQLAFVKGKLNATHFSASRAEDELKIALKYTYFEPMHIMVDPAPGKRALLS